MITSVRFMIGGYFLHRDATIPTRGSVQLCAKDKKGGTSESASGKINTSVIPIHSDLQADLFGVSISFPWVAECWVQGSSVTPGDGEIIDFVFGIGVGVHHPDYGDHGLLRVGPDTEMNRLDNLRIGLIRHPAVS